MPWIPTSDKASLTSSSLNGLIIASTFFIWLSTYFLGGYRPSRSLPSWCGGTATIASPACAQARIGRTGLRVSELFPNRVSAPFWENRSDSWSSETTAGQNQRCSPPGNGDSAMRQAPRADVCLPTPRPIGLSLTGTQFGYCTAVPVRLVCRSCPFVNAVSESVSSSGRDSPRGQVSDHQGDRARWHGRRVRSRERRHR